MGRLVQFIKKDCSDLLDSVETREASDDFLNLARYRPSLETDTIP